MKTEMPPLKTVAASYISLACEDGSLQTAVGHIPVPAPGEAISALGRWSQHPSHGAQFTVSSAERRLPDESSYILEYLSIGIVQGIGAATARLIVERFGDETLDIMEYEPHRLSEVRGVTEKRAEMFGALFARQTSLRRLMELMVRHELSPSYAPVLAKQYGVHAADRLSEDPYILLYEPYGAPFERVDKLASFLGVEDGDVRRLRAGLRFELIYNLDQGHVYLPREKLIPAAAGLLQTPEDPLEDALQDLYCENKIVVADNGIYLTRLYNAEQNVAAFVRERSGRSYPAPGDITELVRRIEEELRIEYAPMQREAIRMAAERGLLVLTGGPGTGKTTILRGMLRLFDWMGLKTLLAAPTGRAAKRMSELCGRDASTCLSSSRDNSRGKITRDAPASFAA